VLADYRPGGTTGAYDMLQAAFADTTGHAPTDFDGDRKSDVLWRHATLGQLWLWPMDGAARTAETYVRTVPDTDWEIRGLGDQNGDGTADILWRNKVNGQAYFWPMAGATPLDEIYVATVDPAYEIVGTGDFDGDGKSDIVWRHATQGDVWIWLMDGAAPLSQAYVDRVDPGYVVKGVGDLDANGKADIVWHHAAMGEVGVVGEQDDPAVADGDAGARHGLRSWCGGPPNGRSRSALASRSAGEVAVDDERAGMHR
jgi:hypothetical protein